MPLLEKELTRCEQCGAQLETGTSSPGCLNCLLGGGLNEPGTTSRRFQHYQVCLRDDGITPDELGRGAMGITYRALDLNLDSPVALKVISAASSNKAEARARFRREARSAAQLRHPNVASVFHFGETEGGECFYAMELVEGETLEARVRRDGPLPLLSVLEVAEQVCRALIAAEGQGLVHRDLKPSNLMVVPNELTGPDALLVKVIDFGLAKAVAALQDGSLQPGFSGTPEFASPEQFNSDKISLDARSDIYSLGATSWYLLCGKGPFSDTGLTETRDQRLHRQLPLEQLTAANVPVPVTALLRSMLAANPEERPQSARELLSAIRACRRAVEGRPPRRRTLMLAALGLALSILTAIGLTRYFSQRPQAQELTSTAFPAPEKSIAVLPFENLSADKENTYFASGVQDEILSDLARIADLKVISRTSVAQFRGGASRNLREIGRALGVAHVLEGSVQRVGNRARINAQLIDARTDKHLWAKTYDRELADVFAIETEVAQAIANELQAKLSPGERALIEQIPTQNLAAYDLYVRAVPLVDGAAFSSTQDKDLLQAVDLLNQALALDPAFLLAYCWLARAHDSIYFLKPIDHTPARLALAKSAIDAAFRLQPDSAEAHLALAWHLYWGYFDYDRARAEIALAGRTLPNNPRVFELQGLMDRRQGLWPQAVHNLERASELDPRNENSLTTLLTTYEMLHNYDGMRKALDRLRALKPNDIGPRLGLVGIELDERADIQTWRAEIQKIIAEDPTKTERLKTLRFYLAMLERDFDAASRITAELPEKKSFDDGYELGRSFWVGLAARLKGDMATAQAAFITARRDQEEIVRGQPEDGQSLLGLAVIDSELGRKEQALQEGKRALELVQDIFQRPDAIAYFALMCARIGERDLAIKQLELVVGKPSGPSYGWLRLSPLWDPIRGDPRFEKIVASLAPTDSRR